MTKPSILVRLASLAVILGSLFGATPPLAQAADDVGAAPDAPHGVTVFNVDRADDASITACTSAPDDCTLRGAINKVNTGTLVDASIYFLLSVSQVNLGAPLPALIVTGTTVYGNVLINGAGLSTGSMMTIDASQVDIGGLSFINGATRDISVLSGSENEIFGVYSGAPDDDVNACLSPGVTRTSTVGIYVGPAVTGDNTTPSLWISNNRINCHALYGIQLDGADGVIIGVNRISGAALPNRIGTDSQGDALGNDGIGIALLANGSNGAKNNQIRNNWIYNSGSQGILLRGTGTNNTNSTATNAITGNRVRGNGRLVAASGIRLMDGAFWNVIGGSAAEDKNYIYRNTGDGIRIENSELNGVLGNIIGGSPSLTGNNTANGVLIDGGKDNWIGGFFILLGSSQAGNEIGGNDGDGIHLRNGARNTKITRNLIGSDSSGVPRPNNNGISILSGSYSTTIGTSNFSDLNVVSGNTLDGIRIDGSTTTSNTIRLNDIGLITNSSGEGCPCPVPNGGFGLVAQNNAHHNRLDGGNYIAHNLSGGVAVLTGAHDNTFGPDPGSGLPEDEIFANAGSGIVFTSGRWNQVRFASIYSNTRDGIEQWSTASDNSWIGTTTYLNGGLGIDIATVANDNIPTAGYPVITSVVRAGGVVTVSGTSAGSNLTNFPVAYYVSTVYLFRDGLDPSGYGEGRTLVGSANTNLSGVWRITYVEGATPRCHAAYSRYVERDVFLGLIADRGSEFSRSTCGPAYVPMVVR